MQVVVALANLCFFLKNEDLNLWSTFSCFNLCWSVSFKARNKFEAVGEGLESKLAVTSIFPKLMNSAVNSRGIDRVQKRIDRVRLNFKYFLTVAS